MVAQLEREQAALLQQLSLLTSLGLGGNGPKNNKDKDGKTTTPRNNLANRVSSPQTLIEITNEIHF